MVSLVGMALKRLRPVDLVILAWIAVASVAAIARMSRAPYAVWVLVAHALVIMLVILVRRPKRPARAAVADLYPLAILLALYGSLDLLAAGGGVTTYDPVIRGWEEAIFGSQVSRTWWQASPSRFWSTVLHASYFSYYLVVPAGPLWFLWRGDRRALERSVLAILATFVVCYLVFLFVPVAGPYYEFARPGPEMVDNWAARLVYGVLENGSSYGAAFPSSHVAATLVATGAAAIASRGLGVVLGVPSFLLTIGVVYCQMHYAVDVLAGIALACLVVGAVVLAEKRHMGIGNGE
jgi:membrane-associated phospholipid phosphatase